MSEEKPVKQGRLGSELNNFKNMNTSNLRKKRQFKIRKKIVGSSKRPRLAVFRSSRYIYAQIIDDSQSKTMVAASDFKLKDDGTKTGRAFRAGKQLAEEAIKKGIKKVVFDRGGFLYHGRVKKLAEGAREGGLEF